MSRLVPLPFEEVREVLCSSGFMLKSSNGSHFKYSNSQTGRIVIVPKHGSKDIPVGTIKSIIKMSGLSRDKFTK